jgi:undecaprenyl-diphosphatase
MNLFQAVIIGIIQGLTEFIPISSTAHLVFASRFFDLHGGNPEQTTATIAVVQLGTLAAVFVYFASDIFSIASSFIRDHWALLRGPRRLQFSGTYGNRPIWLSSEAWLGWLIIIGSIPIGVIGIAFKKLIEGSTTKNLWIIATMLIVIAIMLLIAEAVGSQRKDMNQLSLTDALIVGFAQVLALMPGSSRSGSTIMGGLFAGQNRETAARFSFLLSIPAVTASGLLEFREAYALLPQSDFAPLILATVVSAIVGYLSIWFLISYLRRNTTMIFIVYRLVIGGAILVALYYGTISPLANF